MLSKHGRRYGQACSTHDRDDKWKQFLVGKPMGKRNHLGYPDVDSRIIGY